jgi:acyl-CoA synthetase (NDP forming)
VAGAAGLELPLLSERLSDALAAQLPDTAGTRNPVDLAGGGEQDFMNYARAARTLLESGEVDGVLMTGYFGGYSQYSGDFAERETEVGREIARAVAESGRPLVAQSMYHAAPPNVALREGGVAVYATIEAAATALAALHPLPSPRGAPALPSDRSGGELDTTYFGARALLESAGVPFVAARRVRTSQQAVEAAAEVGYPVVLKALGMLHKSDMGGVVVGIADEDALGWEWGDMEERLAPPEFSVEAMAPLRDGIELILGTTWDPRFGPVVMVGLGGIYTELFRDYAVSLAPVDEDDAVSMLRSLRGSQVLEGVRGRMPVDIPAAARVVATLSRLAAARPDIEEIDVNPLLAMPEGALALDARIISVDEGGTDAG